MQFVIATQDFSGLGFAVRILDEGHEVILAANPGPGADSAACDRVGLGLVPKASLSELMRRRAAMRDWYWIWDFNHSVEENRILRREGFKVLGGGEHAWRMEHDRQACIDFVSAHGLQPPPSFPFASPDAAIGFCRRNRRTAYVYKPDVGESFETFLPESEEPEEANRELQVHLASLGSGNGTFILQERKEGVETNVEVWFHEGQPVFAFMTLECKRKCARDLGELTGCAFDFSFAIPLECKSVAESVGKLLPAYERMRYTGFADANFVAARDGVWFFEKCERFGYNAHPNLLFNLALRPVAEILAGLIDGVKPAFAGGFGAAITMMTKENAPGGKAVQFPESLLPHLYFYDVWKKGDMLLTAGCDRNGYILIVNGYGYTIPTAWESAAARAAQVKFPYRQYRPDGDRTDYPSSPVRRYEALRAMGYL